MNKLVEAIQECMSRYESDGTGSVSARFVFPPDFPGFSGHFPGNPVLPGVCLVQAAGILGARATGSAVHLGKLTAAKWFAPTKPDAELDFAGKLAAPATDGSIVLKVKIQQGKEKIADLTLGLQPGKPGSGGCA